MFLSGIWIIYVVYGICYKHQDVKHAKKSCTTAKVAVVKAVLAMSERVIAEKDHMTEICPDAEI